MAFDIFKLRPTSSTSEAIQAALDKVAAAETEQAAQLRQAREERDRLLLDGTPAALTKAQAAVAAAVEPAEQTATMRQQLEQRLAAALETEKVTAVEIAASEASATAEALSAWWIKTRKKLAVDLAEGMRLKRIASDASIAHQIAYQRGQQLYPHQTFAAAKMPAVEASDWPSALADIAGFADRTNREPFADLATACDPRPPGTF